MKKNNDKETTSWVLGGDGITDIKNPNAKKVAQFNKAVKQPKKDNKKK